MYKWFAILMALCLVVDPGLVYFEQMGGTKDVFMALIVSLAIMPWVSAQFDN